ncbi:MAG TPA: transglycosylase domain-containing protein [Candidatus Dormibacteraeota bacterium]
MLVLVLVAGPALLLTSPGYVAFADRMPEVQKLADSIPTDTLIYASDGATLLADLHGPGYQHYNQTLSEMGTLLPNALIAIEDRNFYSEPGVDPGGVVRAAIVDWHAHGNVEGASTITQQLVKLRLVGPEPTLDRKIREALLSFEVERTYTKNQILEMYVNSAFFGNSAWGGEAAAKIYFHKDTKDLDLAQASMLAGLVRGPTVYNPLLDWKAAKARQQQVLDAMIRAGTVTQADAATAYAEDISPPQHMFTPTNQIQAAGFVRYVVGELVKKFGSAMTYGGGLKVTTTLNPKLQYLAQVAITNTVAVLAYRRVSQGALVALDPTTGAIVSMVASANPTADGGQYNLAVWPPRNPGSSMKIFTYTAAIASKRYTMVTPIPDSAFSYRDPASGEVYTPHNYDGRYHGTLQLQQCMGNSLNIPAVKVELGIGVASVVNMARTMGAPPYQQHTDASGNPVYTTDDALNTFGPSLTLGGYGETPLQMATGASVLATQGLLRQPYSIQSISRNGAIFYEHPKDAGVQVLDPKVAFIMEQIMSNDNNRKMIFGLNSLLTLPGRHVGVKTGTSDSFADAWTVGYTPHLVAAVWTGNPDWRQKMTANSDSYVVAAPAWHSFMQGALDTLGIGDEWYAEPPGLIHRGGNWFLPGT